MPGKKTMKRTVIVLGVIILFVVVAGVIAGQVISSRILPKMKAQVAAATKGRYELIADDPSVGIFSGTINFKNFAILPSQGVSQKAGASYSIKANEVELNGFSIIKMLREDIMDADNFILEGATITIVQDGQAGKPNPDSVLTKLPKIDLPEKIAAMRISNIRIKDSNIRVLRDNKDSTAIFKAADVNFHISNFFVGDSTEMNGSIFKSDSLNFAGGAFSYRFPSDLYVLKGSGLRGSYSDSSLIMEDLRLIPQYDKKSFAAKAGDQVSRVEASAKEIGMKRIDLTSFIELVEMEAELMTVEGLNIGIYRDNTVPIKPVAKPSFQSLIRDIPMLLKIDTTRARNVSVTYEEVAEGGKGVGTMTLTNMNSILTGLSNDSAKYSKNSSIKVFAACKLMGSIPFSMNIEFPLNTREEFFYCSGSVGPGELSVMNQLVGQTRNVKITSGVCDSLGYSFVARNDRSDGSVTFLYHDMKIETSGVEEERKLKDKLKTFVVNAVVKDSNPEKGKEPRKGKIGVPRYPYRYFFYYIMQSITSGVAPSVQGEQTAKLLGKKST
jgi:hypothetical protein